jgi:hypothetical protein
MAGEVAMGNNLPAGETGYVDAGEVAREANLAMAQ